MLCTYLEERRDRGLYTLEANSTVKRCRPTAKSSATSVELSSHSSAGSSLCPAGPSSSSFVEAPKGMTNISFNEYVCQWRFYGGG